MRKAFILTTLLMTIVGLNYAQDYGSIYGTITDTDGAPLPGVSVSVSSTFYPERAEITTESGEFRFLRLPVASD